METLTTLGTVAAYSTVVLLFMVVARVASSLLFRPALSDRAEGSVVAGAPRGDANVALALRHAGLYLAIAIAMTAIFEDGETRGFVADLLLFLQDGAIVVVALIVAQKINDWCIVPGVHNDSAVAHGNAAVGLTEFGSYVATGLIASVSFSDGEVGWLTAIVFFALGQIALVAMFWLQEFLLPGTFVGEVRRGSTAAGVAVAGVLIALGIILRESIAGPFLGWRGSLTAFGLYAAAGIVLLTIFQEVFNSVLVRRAPIEERYHNVATSSVVACGQIGMAIVISALM
jgi:uncharacterized membrane protein YjfL (UPF0719 family)